MSIRIQVSLPEPIHKELTVWAKLSDNSLSQLVGYVTQRAIEEERKRLGVTSLLELIEGED